MQTLRNYTYSSLDAPEIDKSAVKSEQFGCRGKLMTIVCEASGDPKPNIRIIDPDGKRLTGNEFNLEKFGTYKCQASSRLGNDSLNITVSEAKGILKFITE